MGETGGMIILAMDAALDRVSASVVADAGMVATRSAAAGRGQAAALAPMAQAVLSAAGLSARGLSGIAVTVGPGSFTGLRAALALAHGIGLAAGVAVVGVTLAEAFAQALEGALAGRALWVAIDGRQGRVLLDRGAGMVATPLDALPPCGGSVAVAGDAAIAVFARLAARGEDALLTDARRPDPLAVGMVGLRRLRGDISPRAAQPLYVEAPAVTPSPGGLRPAPAAMLP
jgi:tRNA threonylcarbamoyladenosine biosynthesis protein TsaB